MTLGIGGIDFNELLTLLRLRGLFSSPIRLLFGAQRFTHFSAQVGAIDQQHFILAYCRFRVRQDPDVSCDTGVVEYISWQRDDAFQNIATDFALTAACTTSKRRRAVKDNINASAVAY